MKLLPFYSLGIAERSYLSSPIGVVVMILREEISGDLCQTPPKDIRQVMDEGAG